MEICYKIGHVIDSDSGTKKFIYTCMRLVARIRPEHVLHCSSQTSKYFRFESSIMQKLSRLTDDLFLIIYFCKLSNIQEQIGKHNKEYKTS